MLLLLNQAIRFVFHATVHGLIKTAKLLGECPLSTASASLTGLGKWASSSQKINPTYLYSD